VLQELNRFVVDGEVIECRQMPDSDRDAVQRPASSVQATIGAATAFHAPRAKPEWDGRP
jgi:hypothetical protein